MVHGICDTNVQSDTEIRWTCMRTDVCVYAQELLGSTAFGLPTIGLLFSYVIFML